MKVKDIMSRGPKVCHLGNTLADAAAVMWSADCGFVPVVNGTGRLAGVITDRDVCIAAGTRIRPTSELLVDDTMSKEFRTCSPGDDIREALKTMAEGQVRRLPVVDADGALVGVISLNDVIRSAEPAVTGRKPPDISLETLFHTLKTIGRKQPGNGAPA